MKLNKVSSRRTTRAGMLCAYACLMITGTNGGNVFAQEKNLSGAPPTIPHEVRTDLACVDCHSINKIPGDEHLLRNNCQQCHVSHATQESSADAKLAMERFANEWSAKKIQPTPKPIEEASTYEGAPPVIPHSTQWASNCMSCHSDLINDGYATSHYNRQNCQQCHVSLAVMESRKFVNHADEPYALEWKSELTQKKEGRRQVAKKPMMIPHELTGRSNCLECHSPDKTVGMATPHPERNNCQQCHIASAHKEDRNFISHSTPSELK